MTGAGWVTFGTRGSRIGQFNDPGGIALDVIGRIYVADSQNHRITRIDNMIGGGWTTLGASGSGDKQFSGPRGLTLDSEGRLYVVDSGNNRIVRVNAMTGDGWVALSGHYGTAIAVDGDGRIYFAELVDDDPPSNGQSGLTHGVNLIARSTSP
jgi:DNA-binding beta-propeller fold protein YncE